MKRAIALFVTVFFAISVLASDPAGPQTSSTTTTTTKKKMARKAEPKAPTLATQVEELKAAVAAQQQQIQQLMQQLQQQRQSLSQAQQQASEAASAASAASSKADSAASEASTAQQSLAKVQTDVTDVKANATTQALELQETQKKMNESPVALKFKGITLTPGGFLAAETVYRQHSVIGDVNTPFTATPFPGANNYNLSEFFGSGRQSRITLLAEGKLSSATLRGYYEADWLSAGVTSNGNQSNSYTNRQRQLFAQAQLDSGWIFTGGQQWSLVTETKSLLNNRTEALPMTIDAQYHVGFSWTRQYGFRVVKNMGTKAALGFSVENAQALVTVHGNASNFLLGGPGAGGGLYNFSANYSANAAPDFVLKLAAEPGFGHYEIGGIISTFRDRVYPNATAAPASATGAHNDTEIGGGIFANARWSMFHKHMDFGIHYLGGNGVGRYGTSTLADATVRPDGTLALLHNHMGLGTLEFHYPKIDVYFNGGVEYASPYVTLSGGKAVGYGGNMGIGFNNTGCNVEVLPANSSTVLTATAANGYGLANPANCTADTRVMIEGTAGFWYKVYNGPKGRIQFGPQYSYLVRNPWGGATGLGGAPDTKNNMFFTSFRYYLP